ncbi:MAG: hypothetical protein ACYCZO_17025 [Daejeonella sp.]
MQRDNFTQPTISSLAKRVGFLCSNPFCKKHTSGPHIEPHKSTTIGVAAHITAASPQGPRYDSNLTESERSSITNAVWLCANCYTLIDKDPKLYPAELLQHWKKQAEESMLSAMQGRQDQPTKNPFLEAELFWTGASRSPRGYSDKNPTEIENGMLVTIIGAGVKPIIFWELNWRFTLAIHNNSSYPAFNLKIENIGVVQFSELGRLRAVNNLQPFSSIELKAGYRQFIEDIHTEADRVLSFHIPEQLEGLTLKISYLDEDRNSHSTIVKIVNNQITNSKS